MSDRTIILGMPGYGTMTANAAIGVMRACADMTQVDFHYQNGSLLAANFNKLWCAALNRVQQGGRVDYFAMLHDDIGPQEFWLDALIDELEAKKLDVLGVVVPIKDRRGMTSMALANGWPDRARGVWTDGDAMLPYARLSMHDVFELPETFTSRDLRHPLLLNTGCWVCKFDMAWASRVHFEINDRIAFNTACGRYQSQTEPEDWFFSRQCHEQGLKIGATRKIKVIHSGRMDFTNDSPWGSHAFDSEAVPVSPVPGAFPWDIEGWLRPSEGKALAELAAGKRVLEIGSYCGLSTVCMARTAEHVTAVDYFDGRGTPQPQSTLKKFKASIERYGVADRVTIASPEDEFTGQCELLFIDGAHDRESVAADIERYLPLLSEDGLIAFHDYNEPCHPGVTSAVEEFVAAGGELVSVTEHLAVVRPPAAIPLEV